MSSTPMTPEAIARTLRHLESLLALFVNGEDSGSNDDLSASVRAGCLSLCAELAATVSRAFGELHHIEGAGT